MADTAIVVEADGLLESIGEVVRKLEANQLELDEAIRQVKEKYSGAIDELTAKRDELVDKLAALANEHREELVEPESKTASLRHGKLQWRSSRPSLKITGDESAIIQQIRRLGKLRRFTRLGKRTLDKAELKKSPEFIKQIPGLEIVQSEDLVIKPTKVQSEIIRTGNPLKVPVPEKEKD